MDSTALALTLAGFGVLLICLSYQRHLHHRTVSAMAHGILGVVLFLCGALLLTVTLNFNTYDTLKTEQPLAELSLEKSGPQTFQAHLMRIPAGDLQVFTLKGDRWQMQAQLLEWQGWARWLGLTANVRLERLLSSFDPVVAKPNGKTSLPPMPSNYGLSHNPGISLWDLQNSHPEQMTALRTQALQTESFPLLDGMRYHLYLSDGVLTARAINQPRPVAQKLNAPTVNYQGTVRGTGKNGPDDAADMDAEADDAPAAPTVHSPKE